MRPLRAVFVAAIVVGLVVGCSSRDRPIEARLDRADDLLGRHKPARARSEIEAAIRLDPSRAETYRAAAGIYLKRDRGSDAASVAERLLERAKAKKLDETFSREGLAWLYVTLGEAYQKAHDLARAEKAYRDALVLAPDSAQLLNCLAYFYAEEGIKLDEGLRLARRAVALAPGDGNIVDTLGWAQYKLGRYGAAARTLARAVRLEPDSPELRYHLGAAYAKLKREPEARIELAKALVLDNNMREAARLLRSLHTRGPAPVGD